MREKKTRILCTMGPASIDQIEKLVSSGMDSARMNFSHGSHSFHKEVFEKIRKAEKKTGKYIAVLADLQGPKIRITKLAIPPFLVKTGDEIWLNNIPGFSGTQEELGCTYKGIVNDLSNEDRLLLDDGKVVFKVIKKEENRVLLRVVSGGYIRDNKGINLPGTKITSPALTPKDIQDLKFAINLGVDYIGLSFVRSAEDLRLVRKYLKKSFIGLIAKIERPEALENIDEIIEEADGIMIARGDLGIEIETERVPIIQKQLISTANLRGKLVITATHMLESMIENPSPTRAEAADIANAVLDGTDTVMLSGETAVGKYPIEAVAIMSRIIKEAEKILKQVFIAPGDPILKKDEISLGKAAVTVADAVNAKAIINFTRSGYSAQLASRFRPGTKIISFTPFILTARKMTLLWGVMPYVMPLYSTYLEMQEFANSVLKKTYGLKKNDKVVILAAALGSTAYSTDMIQIYTIK
jgi:pyruvate kinase